MTWLVLGLCLFLGVHSVRIFGEGWRTQMLARLGEGGWKGVYSVLSLLGLVLIIWGYGIARQQPLVLWPSPAWARHLASPLTLLAFVLLVAAYVPGNWIKAKVHHPMVVGVKVWAFSHLLANNTVADVVLFGSFVLWAVLNFRAARARDRAAGTVYAAGRWGPTLVTVLVGIVAWLAFALWAHQALFGVRPFG